MKEVIIYDKSALPENMTMKQVLNFYKKTGIVLWQSNKQGVRESSHHQPQVLFAYEPNKLEE